MVLTVNNNGFTTNPPLKDLEGYFYKPFKSIDLLKYSNSN